MNPLEQLKDIHLPQAVSYWPPAWPWWALLALVIGLLVLIVWYRKKQAWRRAAIQQCHQINWQSQYSAYREANKLLKQICIQKIDPTCARLSGEPWLNFLDQQVKQPIFSTKLRPFAHVLDEPNIQLDDTQLKHAMIRWIRKVQC